MRAPCFVLFFALPLFAYVAPLGYSLRARWRPAALPLLINLPLTALALLGPASMWSEELTWLQDLQWAAPLAAAIVCIATCIRAFRAANAENYDLERHDWLERCAFSFVAAGLLYAAYAVIFAVAIFLSGAPD